ncbi:MAG: TatD family hydrolase [Kiritimatiellae bacterium]|nr:TatD family hydrolase [Kiritimatiellia bacterium]
MVDTHAHFEGTPLETEAVLRRAADEGVTALVAVGGSDALNAGAIAAATVHPAFVRLAIGFDRDQATAASPDVWCETLRLLVEQQGLRPAAIGEIGLDYHYTPESRHAQCALFTAQLRLADEWGLPVSIHTREADDDTLRILDESPWRHDTPRGVIHCFTGGAAFADALLARGFAISFSGIVTFKNAEALRAVAAAIPADRFLIETDSPFLAPVPKRGQRNEPAFVKYVAECLAQVRHTTVAAIEAATTRNALAIFG